MSVLAVVDDLFFAVKIEAAARQSGVAVAMVKTEAAAWEGVRGGAGFVLVDLNLRAFDLLAWIAAVKAEMGGRVSLLGFISHVDVERKEQALAAGCDRVIARSAFSADLPLLLKRHAAALQTGA
jgi:CheY-like chemotaxis protein